MEWRIIIVKRFFYNNSEKKIFSENRQIFFPIYIQMSCGSFDYLVQLHVQKIFSKGIIKS